MANLLKKAWSDMKESAKAQHEVNKAEFKAVKAESKANFEYNRGKNSLKRAKEQAKQSWDDAHMSPAERTAKVRAEQQQAIQAANERIDAAEQKLAELKENN